MIERFAGNILPRLSVVCALLVMVGGCGQSPSGGPTRYEVSGTVTYDGKPVPSGFVYLNPDTSQGNNGPGGGAPITDGAFQTEAGKGVVGGPYKVRIVGYTGVPATMEGEELPDGVPLFDPYETTVDFPAEDTEQNFEVPKE